MIEKATRRSVSSANLLAERPSRDMATTVIGAITEPAHVDRSPEP